MLTTQQFSNLCKTTKRTIIHYDQIGLLKPLKREKLNRFYSTKQILTFEKITLLKSVGFSLKEIHQKLDSRQSLIKIFKEDRLKIVEQQIKINNQMKKIDEILFNLEQNQNILNPVIKKIEPFHFYGIEQEGTYADIENYCHRLAEKIGDKKFLFTYFVTFKEFLIEEYSPTKSSMIIGAIPSEKKSLSPKKDVTIYNIDGHTVLSSFYKGSHASLGYIWKFMWKYFKKKNLSYDNKILIREIYSTWKSNKNHEENFVTELQIPIIS